MDNNEYIMCAAIKLADEPRIMKTTNTDLAICEIGYRHCDIFERFGKLVSRHPHDQGFFTSKGRFVDRWEAMKIAYKQRQLKEGVQPWRKGTDIVDDTYIWNRLYSEDLY